MDKALQGIRVLSFGEVLAAPFAQLIMADLGAEIIKVEPPGLGDKGRAFGPFISGESVYFTSLNRNAKSVVIDLKKPKGVAIAKELAKLSDVVLENYRPGVMEKLGLGYTELSKINPRLVYTSITGFGNKDILCSPYADRPAYDILAQAMGGLMSINGEPGGPPLKIGIGLGDIIPGMFGAIGTLAALRVAELTGEGQRVDISLLDSIIAVMENPIQMYTHTGIVRQPTGNMKHHTVAPYAAYPCLDGWVVIAAGNDKLWANLCRALGREEWISDPRFGTNDDRLRRADELINPWLREWTRSKTRAEIEEHLLKHDVPVAPVLNAREIVEHPHTAARQMLVEVEHPVLGRELLVNSPVKMSRTMPAVEAPAPLLGQHTEEVLSGLLGYSTAEIAALREEGVVN